MSEPLGRSAGKPKLEIRPFLGSRRKTGRATVGLKDTTQAMEKLLSHNHLLERPRGRWKGGQVLVSPHVSILAILRSY